MLLQLSLHLQKRTTRSTSESFHVFLLRHTSSHFISGLPKDLLTTGFCSCNTPRVYSLMSSDFSANVRPKDCDVHPAVFFSPTISKILISLNVIRVHVFNGLSSAGQTVTSLPVFRRSPAISFFFFSPLEYRKCIFVRFSPTRLQ